MTKRTRNRVFWAVVTATSVAWTVLTWEPMPPSAWGMLFAWAALAIPTLALGLYIQRKNRRKEKASFKKIRPF